MIKSIKLFICMFFLIVFIPFDLISGALIAHYPLEGNANDIISGNNGILNGGILARPGKIGNAYIFDGIDDFIEAPDSAITNFGSLNFTVSFWVYKMANSTGWYNSPGVNKWNTGASPGTNAWSLIIGGASDNKPGFAIEGTDLKSYIVYSTTNLQLNKWTHVAGVRDGNYIKIYVDGILKNTLYIGNVAVNNPANRKILIGKIAAGFNTNAIFDEVKIWNHALSDLELQNESRNIGKLLLHYKFEDNANDSSVNENNGVIFGTLFANGKIGKCANFDGFDDYIRVNSSNLTLKDQITIMAWVRTNGTAGTAQTYSIFSRINSVSPWQGYAFEIGGYPASKYAAFWNGAKWSQGIKDVNDNNWHHLSATYDGNSVKIYVDGQIDNIIPSSGNIDFGNIIGFVGKSSSSGRYFNGFIDELKIYDYVLTDTEIFNEVVSGCVPKTCTDLGKQCGTWGDECGQNLNCGTCSSGQICSQNGLCLTSSLVSHYPFDSNPNDIISGNNGVLYNGIVSATGNTGNAYLLDGVDDYIEAPDFSGIDFANNDFTISFFVNKKKQCSNWDECIGVNKWNTGASPGTNEWSLTTGDGSSNKPMFAIESGTTTYSVTSPEVIPLNSWTYITGVREGNYIKIYVNGELKNSLNMGNFNVNNVGRKLLIGKILSGYNTNAIFDEVKIWNYALKPETIFSEYSAGRKLVAHYSFEGNANDISGNGNNGVVSGPTFEAGKVGSFAKFDGIDDFISVNSNSLELKNHISIMAWIRTSGSTNMPVSKNIFSRYLQNTPSPGYGFEVGGLPASQNAAFFYGSGTWTQGNKPINDNKWHHVVAIFDGSYVRFYVDGAFDSKIAVSGTPNLNSGAVMAYIGKNIVNQRYFSGDIDELKIYDYLISEREILDEYVKGATSEFITVKENEFYLGTSPFYFSGGNTYYLWYGNYNCQSYDVNQGCSKEIFDDAVLMNFTVLRVWGFSDGTSSYWGQLQPTLRGYNENDFKKFDNLILEAKKRNIKLIIPLVNNWNDFGGMCQYVKWCNIPDSASCNPASTSGTGAIVHDKFYTDSCTRQAYKDYVNYVLNRKNSYTGVAYKDEPTIMAWELANEPRAHSDLSGASVDNWIEEMSTYIKSIDSKHLVTVGEEGWNNYGTNFIQNHNHKNIDYMSFHLLVEDMGFSHASSIDWINSHIDAADSQNKPIVLEEIGKKEPSYSSYSDFYKIIEKRNVDGDMIWMLKDSKYPDYDGYGIDYPTESVSILSATHATYMKNKKMASPPDTINFFINQQDLYTSGLVDSYEADGNDFAYTYDQALAVIVFTNSGDLVRARKVLDRLKSLQATNGGWLDCYKASDLQVCNSGQNQYSTGPIAWIVIAINYYQSQTGDTQYRTMAANAITWMNTMRNINSADERYGSLRFCSGTSCTIPSAISTEHNADAYSAYFWRGKLENNQAYISNANLIKDYITKEMWAPSASSNGIHTANVFWRGYNDYAYCTDPQAWTVLSLGLAGNSGEEFYKSLDWLYYSPYGNTKSLQDYSPSVLDVDGFKSCTEQLTNFIWIEGTEQSALAFKLINKTRGDYFHNQMNRIPVTNYGKIYSFSETSPTNLRYMENWRYNSVAGTAWNYFYARNINPFVPPNSEYWVSTVVNGNNIENKIYYRNHHFLSILQNNGSFVLRPHPGIDVDGWGSSLYMQPFFPGATLKNSNVESITISNDGVNVIAKGKVSRSTSLTYGDWNFNMKFSYKPDSREIFGNGDYSIVLSGAMNSLTSDLNLYKIASNYLDNVPLLGGGIGDTGDMEYADYLVDSSGGRWTPPLQPGHFPSESGKYISVDVSGDYYNVDTVRQGYNYIKPAYKPSLKIELSSSSNVPINFGAIYNTAGATQFWLDNVGITPIVKSSYTGTTYNFNSKFYSKALPGDGTAIK